MVRLRIRLLRFVACFRRAIVPEDPRYGLSPMGD